MLHQIFLFSFRIGIPEILREVKLEKGEFVSLQNEDGISIMKYRDKKEIFLIFSTCAPKDTVVVGNKTKPVSVNKYNKEMGHCDQTDQQCNLYSQLRRSNWAHKLIFRLFELSQNSARGLFKEFSGWTDTSVRAFARGVSTDWTGFNCVDNVETVREENVVEKSEHCLKNIPKRKRCRVCALKKVRKDTSFVCPACDRGYCVECFFVFHSSEIIKNTS